MFAKTKNIVLANRPLYYVGSFVLEVLAFLSAILSVVSPIALLVLYFNPRLWEEVFFAPARLKDVYTSAHAKARIMAKPIYFFDDCAKAA
ncbi:hypothetical protein [Vibrio phage vB_VmeM-Yong XC32]|nr:hypothetical protein [Vibrio phage vB_VmeM-Yong XC31]QAX96438.1 hypothetical protein [Vibrio phage vB_VmeM-Yong XC32]QAX96755.1 hypothetical protein [Vibrio phage vB_VmeM-Yong MS31]QAX97074.1 hypothetical protein [Vibrio phage vB_VmeM-Yong MS32]